MREHNEPRDLVKLTVCLFNPIELSAINKARNDGWLEVSSEISERVLNRWARECERRGKPYAALRRDAVRSSFWFVLPAGRSWNEKEQTLAKRALRLATVTIISGESARGFLPLGDEAQAFKELFAIGSISVRKHPRQAVISVLSQRMGASTRNVAPFQQ